jgi:hypothetical protein
MKELKSVNLKIKNLVKKINTLNVYGARYIKGKKLLI